MKLRHAAHGLVVYAAAVVPQLLLSHQSIDRDVLLSLVPGLIAAVASAFLPSLDAAKVEKAVTEVLPK